MKGAGGTSGGIGQFFIGLAMMSGGFYLLLNAISVNTYFGMHRNIFGFSVFGSSMGVTGGMIMIPMIFGIGMIFFNGKTWLGWLLFLGSLAAMIFGVISSIHFQLRSMSAFELIVILVLAFGGLGLFLRSLKNA